MPTSTPPLKPRAVATFVRQRFSNYLYRRQAGDPLDLWLAAGIGRYLAKYATRRERQVHLAPDSDLRARLAAHRALNFGCGYDKREGFVNVDSHAACEPDVLIDSDSASLFPTDHYKEILAKDVLEHIPRAGSLRMMLHFNDWLAEDGVLHLQTTSITGVADRLKKYPGFDSHSGMTICLFGSQAHPGDFHYTGFTEVTLRVLLLAAGFALGDLSLVDEWMFKVDALKQAPWYRWDSQAAEQLTDLQFTEEVFEHGLTRVPSPSERQAFLDMIGRLGRKGAALEVFSSPERLIQTARHFGY